jgi:hypothetical protein
MTEKIPCPICIEEYYLHNIVTCPSCNFSCCKTCMKTYIFKCENDNVICMNRECNKRFLKTTLFELLPVNWLNKEFKKYQHEIRFKKQQTLFSDVMGQVEYEVKSTKLRKHYKDIESEMKEKIAGINLEYKLKLTNATDAIYAHHNTTLASSKVKKKFIKPCAFNNCKGMLDLDWKCGICDMITCSKCFEHIKDINHICSEDNIKTVELIKKTTKNCPTCGEGIYKIEGCDQMYCTSCNTAFSWNTGKIVVTNIHNPHYFEYLRKQSTNGIIPRQQGDLDENLDDTQIDCINDNYLLRFTMKKFKQIQNYDTYAILILNFTELIRLYLHSKERYNYIQREIINSENELRNLRIQFLSSIISEDKFKKLINTIYKRNEMYEESHSLIETIYLIAESIIKKYLKLYLIKKNNTLEILQKFEKEYRIEIDEFKKIIHKLDFENNKITQLYNMVNPFNLYNSTKNISFNI